MSLPREQIGPAQQYRGRTITAHKLPIDVLMRIDGHDAGIYLSVEGGFKAKMRAIDDEERRKERDRK